MVAMLCSPSRSPTSRITALGGNSDPMACSSFTRTLIGKQCFHEARNAYTLDVPDEACGAILEALSFQRGMAQCGLAPRSRTAAAMNRYFDPISLRLFIAV